jgi:asparagine synthase (glutamine-hydrolysing)
MQLVPAHVRRALWTKDAERSFSLGEAEVAFGKVWDQGSSCNVVDQMRATDIATYLPGDLLVKVDIASMAHSLEVRSPFLDQEVLALAARMPREALVRGRTTKWILRQLAYRLVPRELVDRPKRGFGIPRAAWMRGPMREATHDLLLDNTARQRGWWRPEVVERLLKEHDSGDDRDLYLWPMLMIENWARIWVD